MRECVEGERACGVRPGLRAGAPGVGAGADGACVRERRGGGEGGRDHRAPPLGPARCLAMSQPAPAPTSSVWVSGSCPEGLCRWPGQPTYPPGPGAGQRPISAANSHSEAKAGPGGGPPARIYQCPERGRGCVFHVWLTALCLFSSSATGMKRQGEGGGEVGVEWRREGGESASGGQKLC